jgi:hypothetical protein
VLAQSQADSIFLSSCHSTLLFCKGRPSSGTFRAATSPHQFARSVQSHLPIWQWLRRLLRVLQLLSKEGREKWMDKLRSERQPLIHGFTDFHDMIFFMTSTS